MANKPLAGLTSSGKIPSFAKVSNGNKMGVFPFKKTPELKSRDALESALVRYERRKAESDRIRAAAGLPPVPENTVVAGWRSKLAALPERKATQKVAAAPKRQEALTPAEQVRAVAKRRRELEREREAIDAETRRLVELAQTDRTLSVSGIADALGLSRQRLYQLAGS